MPESPRLTLGNFTGGVDMQTDPSVLGMQFSPNAMDISMARGICESRAGYRILDAEPSYLASGTPRPSRQSLTFDAASSESGAATFTRPLKNQFSIIYEGLPTDTADGTYVLATVYDGSNLIARLEYVVASSTVAYRIRLRDSSGTAYTGITPALSTAAWGDTRRYVVAICGSSPAIYVGGVAQTLTVSGSQSGVFATPANFYLSFDGSAQHASQAISQIVLVNRNLTSFNGAIDNFAEAEPMRNTYFPMGYPVDSIENDPDVLLHYTFTENTGTTVYDWSQFGADMTLTNTPTWVTAGGQHLMGRGLGMGVWRAKDGTRYNVLGFTRNAPRGTTNVKQGVIYVDRCDKTWDRVGAALNKTVYYIGGSSTADQASPSYAGLDTFARMQFLQMGHRMAVLNGVDYIRTITVATWNYLGGTAPPSAPVVGSSGSGANFKICYTYYNPVDDVETGRSPLYTVTDDQIAGTTVQWFLSSDTQFTHVRIYRTINNGTKFYLETTQVMGAAAYTVAVTDANIISNPVLAGDGSAEGNRKVKRLYLAFPDFRPEEPNSGQQRAPASGPTLGVTGASGSLSTGNYYVAYAYRNSTTGDETGMSPWTLQAVTANDRIDVSAMVLPGDSNYNQIVLYRTKASAFTWYEDKVISAAATTTLTQADSALATTIETKSLPPLCPWGVVFGNRLWLLGTDGTLYWSTQGDLGAFPFDNAYRGRGKVGAASIVASGNVLMVGYEDGVVYAIPNPGSEVNLLFFMIVNYQLYSEYGGCIAQDTVRETAAGMLWLSTDGVYRFDGEIIERISDPVTPFFRYLNLGRARYATAIWKDDESLYMVAVPRGVDKTSRLNDSWMTYFTPGGRWMPYSLPPVDVMGLLEDANGNDHYCFLMPTGLLCELLTNMVTQQAITGEAPCYDGVETQAEATLAGVTACSCTALSYTAPSGFDGGFPMWMIRQTITSSITNHTVQRFVLRNGTPFLTGFNFYPMMVTGVTATYKGYLGGIRAYWITARFSCTPEEPDRASMIEDSFIHQKIGAFGTPSIQAVLAGETPNQSFMMKLPTPNTATAYGIQHTATLAAVEDGPGTKLQTQHGGWPSVASAMSTPVSAAARNFQFMFVNNPPTPNTTFIVASVAFRFTPQEYAG